MKELKLLSFLLFTVVSFFVFLLILLLSTEGLKYNPNTNYKSYYKPSSISGFLSSLGVFIYAYSF